jgi:hypothetical protein
MSGLSFGRTILISLRRAHHGGLIRFWDFGKVFKLITAKVASQRRERGAASLRELCELLGVLSG